MMVLEILVEGTRVRSEVVEPGGLYVERVR